MIEFSYPTGSEKGPTGDRERQGGRLRITQRLEELAGAHDRHQAA